MEKEFIPYTEALVLKELGFNEECLAYYNLQLQIEFKSCYNKVPIIMSGKKCGIPLYQQAFRWFREKYDIKPCFDWHPTEEYRYCIYYSKNTYFQKCDFLTHEEAELDFLTKIIEIVKSKTE
jgi:hypothetical protein